MARVTLHTICQDAFPASAPTPPLPTHVRKAARALRPGRTAVRGGQVHACPAGHRARVWSTACRHRSCPPCASLQTARWWALQQARLLAWAHDPGMCTLPHALPPLWRAHVPVLRTLLGPAVRERVVAWRAAAKELGAPPGLSAARPTWSQPLGGPPQGPWVVTGGGVPPDGPGQAVRPGVLLPARGVRAVWRGQRRAALRRAWTRGEWGGRRGGVLRRGAPGSTVSALRRRGAGRGASGNARPTEPGG
jgi:hypothetical protein